MSLRHFSLQLRHRVLFHVKRNLGIVSGHGECLVAHPLFDNERVYTLVEASRRERMTKNMHGHTVHSEALAETRNANAHAHRVDISRNILSFLRVWPFIGPEYRPFRFLPIA